MLVNSGVLIQPLLKQHQIGTKRLNDSGSLFDHAPHAPL